MKLIERQFSSSRMVFISIIIWKIKLCLFSFARKIYSSLRCCEFSREKPILHWSGSQKYVEESVWKKIFVFFCANKYVHKYLEILLLILLLLISPSAISFSRIEILINLLKQFLSKHLLGLTFNLSLKRFIVGPHHFSVSN